MSVPKGELEGYIRRFPSAYRPALLEKLSYRSSLIADKRLRIPARIWFAFLTPADTAAHASSPPAHAAALRLKVMVLEAFAHPKRFLEMRGSRLRASDCVTLSLLEILFDLEEQKVLLPEERYSEWLEVADRFGLWKLRYALEDAIFKVFDPESYALFESVVRKQLFTDNHLVLTIRAIVEDALKKAGVREFAVENRTKNIAGVYKKVALKNKSINDIYDIHGFRIITASLDDCYRARDVLHRLWPHFSDRHKDYIEKPKENGYQSIHTVLKCLEGKPIEFQIRTRDMDVIAASGPANHAEYKRATGAVSARGISS